MSRFVRTFGERYPGANVRLEYLHPTRVVESVSDGGAELGLVSFPRKWPELTVIPWRVEEMVLAVCPSHRFATRGEVEASALDGEVFVSYDSELPIRRAIDRFLRRNDVTFSVALEFDNIEHIKRAVEIPAGIAFLPEPTLDREIEAGTLVAVRVTGCEPERQLTRPLAAVYRRHHQLSLSAARFLELLTEEGGAVASAASPGILETASSGGQHVTTKP
jgi:DNA-binding transcriptional LysR family regulator